MDRWKRISSWSHQHTELSPSPPVIHILATVLVRRRLRPEDRNPDAEQEPMSTGRARAVTPAFDLEVDTDLIRRSATTVDDAARGFSAFRPTPAALPDGALGSSGTAEAALRLVNLRATQALQAAQQLGSIAAGLSAALLLAAERFERLEGRISAGLR